MTHGTSFIGSASGRRRKRRAGLQGAIFPTDHHTIRKDAVHVIK